MCVIISIFKYVISESLNIETIHISIIEMELENYWTVVFAPKSLYIEIE